MCELHVHTKSTLSVNVYRYDPTHTTTLRNRFASSSNRYFNYLVNAIRSSVSTNNSFGFGTGSGAEQIRAFNLWLDNQLANYINSNWMDKYVEEAYRKGLIRARNELIKAGYQVPRIDDVNALMRLPQHAKNIALLKERLAIELRGITEALKQQLGRVLSSSVITGDTNKVIAQKLISVITGKNAKQLGVTDTLGRFMPARRRAELMARTEVVRAHHLANIAEYRSWGVEGVRIMAEWLTAGDERVCFLATTKITTKNGYIYIKDVKVGDEVLTHMNRYRKVTKLFCRKYDGNVVRITLKGGNYNAVKLTATENHLILVNNQWIQIKDIKIGDKVSYIAKKCPICKKLMPVFNTYCSYSCCAKVANKVIWSDPKQKDRVRENNKKYEEIYGVSKIQLAKASHVEKLKEPIFYENFCNQVSKGQIKSYKNNPDHLTKVTLANQEKGKRENWGWKNKEKLEKDIIKAHIAIGKNHNGKTYLEKKVEWWLKKKGFKYESQKYFNNGDRKFWVDFYLPDYNIIIEADGSHWHNVVADRERDKQLKKVFTGKIIHFKEDDIRNNFHKCITKLNTITELQNCFIDVEVKKVIKWKLKKVQPVYNLEVEEDNTYTANKIVVHNCNTCASLEGRIFTLDEIEGMIPQHPQCRCMALPIKVNIK